MLTLGIDTSNYATSLAVYFSDNNELIYNDKQFLPVKQGEIGLRQSDAVFHHTLALPQMLLKLKEQVDIQNITNVGVSCKPRDIENSYMPCFLAGVCAAQSFALAKNINLYKTTHQQGHIAAALFGTDMLNLFNEHFFVFHVSGGTTELLLCKGIKAISIIGKSTDLYAGQAVDRLGVKLGFSFPSGEQLSALAQKNNDEIKPKVSVKGINCSFSGLENICDKLMNENKPHDYIARYCLLAISETILKMVIAARKQYGNYPVVFAGGVMASNVINKHIKSKISDAFFTSQLYSSDNAIGVAILAARGV